MSDMQEKIPSIAEWAEYGTNPGVLIGVIIVLGSINTWFITKLFQFFISWHTEQMDAIRQAHAADREKYIVKLDEIKDEIVEVCRAIDRAQK